MNRFVAWYSAPDVVGEYSYEGKIFATADEANRQAYAWSNTVPNWIDGGTFKVPTRWTNRGALRHAENRADRARDAYARKPLPWIVDWSK